MVWVKLDDQILDNEKIINAGPLGFALHVAAITWCGRNLTDGFIPRSKARGLLSFEGLTRVVGEGQFHVDHEHVEADAVIGELVACRLWAEDLERGGYHLKDFLEYNPSKANVLAEREVRSQGAKRAASARWSNRGTRDVNPHTYAPHYAESMRDACADPCGIDAQTHAESMRERCPVPVPVPVPDQPSVDIISPPPVAEPKAPRRSPETACPSSDASPSDVTAWAYLWKLPETDPQFAQFLDWHRARDQRRRDWTAAWRTWQRNAKTWASARPGSVVQSAENRAWKMPEGFE